MTKACTYLRLSREDGDSMESNSISNQRQIIQTYAKVNDITIAYEYVDDGYSGSNFERPEFKKMIQDLEEGKFSTIIVKDLFVLVVTTLNLENIFKNIPWKRCSFHFVTDGYDSENADMSDTHLILPIKNFINDSYCRDISMKVKSAKDVKRKNGEFIGLSPFWLQESLENKHQLVADEEVSHIIKQIFQMKLEGFI